MNTTDLTNGGAKSSQIKFSKSVTLQTLQAKTTNLEYDKVHFLIESLSVCFTDLEIGGHQNTFSGSVSLLKKESE